MKTKNKNKLKLLLFLLCFPAGLFVLANSLKASDQYLFISEAAVGITNSSNEFVELYNSGDTAIDLKAAGIKLKLADSSGYAPSKQITWIKTTIGPKDYFLFGTGTVSTSFDATYSSASLTGVGGVIITDKNNVLIDELSWGEKPPLIKVPPLLFPTTKGFEVNQSDGLKNNQSIERKSISHPEDNNLDFILQLNPNPQHSIYIPPEEKPVIYSKNITINELSPYPPSGQEEFIELYNPTDKSIDLENWILHDGSQSGKYVFPKDSSLAAKNFLVVYKKDFSFALNNSGQESVTLYNPNNELVSTVSYDGAKENESYDFDGSKWHWSKFLTPGAENIFDTPVQTKTEIDDTIYAGMYADFSASESSASNTDFKFTWDFGDGHKSYLAKTRHKYADTGKYTVTLKTTGGSEDKLETWEIEVEDFPKLEVKIIGLSPNPAGKDADSEWIKLQNNSKKKINLKDWSIATGSKKLYNHPIADDLIIKSKAELKITHAESKFSLNNIAAKIELRYPNGKVASKAHYESKKSVAEDATYEKTKLGWIWKVPATMLAKMELNSAPELSSVKVASENTHQQLARDIEVQKNLGKYSENNYKKQNQIILLSYATTIQAPPITSAPTGKVLGAFTENQPARKHWAVKLYENLGQKINYLLTLFFLKLTA